MKHENLRERALRIRELEELAMLVESLLNSKSPNFTYGVIIKLANKIERLKRLQQEQNHDN